MKPLVCHSAGGPPGGAPADRNRSGFSLLELLIAIAVMGILATIATFNFNSWQVKSKMEAQVRELQVDLNEARINAFTQKRPFGIVFQTNSYTIKSYSSLTEAASPVDNGTTVVTKNVLFALTKRSGTSTSIVSIADTPVVFDTSGTTFNWFTILVDPSKTDAAVNCIVISTTRTNMGKLNGTTCEFK